MLGRMCMYTGGGGKSDIQPIASWTQIRLGTLGTQATTRLAAGTGGSREPPVPAGLYLGLGYLGTGNGQSWIPGLGYLGLGYLGSGYLGLGCLGLGYLGLGYLGTERGKS